MRILISIVGLGIGMLGILFVVISFKEGLKINLPVFAVAATGFIMMAAALIIALLVDILTELKRINNPH
jgi:hypothetical protein